MLFATVGSFCPLLKDNSCLVKTAQLPCLHYFFGLFYVGARIMILLVYNEIKVKDLEEKLFLLSKLAFQKFKCLRSVVSVVSSVSNRG